MRASRFNITLSAGILWLFLLLLPTQLGKHFFFDFSYISGVRVDYLAPALYLTDLVAGLLIMMYWKHVAHGSIRHARFLVYLMPLILMNIGLSQQPYLCFYGWLKIAEIYALFQIFRSIHIPQWLSFSALTVGALAQTTLTLMQFQLHRAVQGPWYWLGERALSTGTSGVAKASLFGTEILRPYGTFSHPNSLGGFYLLIVAWCLSTPARSTKLQWLKALLVTLASMLVLMSFSKTAIITLFIVVGVFGLRNRKVFVSCKLCMVARVCIGLSILAFFLSAHGDVYSLEKRLILMKEATTILLSYPLFGTGLWNNLYAHAHFAQRYPYVFIQPVHNIFLLWMMQVGLLISALTGWWGWMWLRANWSQRHLFILPLLVIILTGSVDHYWLTLQQNILLMGVVGGMISSKLVSKS